MIYDREKYNGSYFKYLEDLMKDKDSLMSGITEDGERVDIQYNQDKTIYTVTAYQDNDWIRVTNYYQDGTTDESYHK